MFFLTGVARYLFVPMAEAVVFAMLASYVLSRTLVPTMAKYLLHAHEGARHRPADAQPARADPARDRPRLRAACATATARCSSGASADAGSSPRCSSPPASRRCSWRAGSARISSRRSTAGSSSCTCARRAARASRRRRFSRDHVEAAMRELIPAGELAGIIDNIGLPYSRPQPVVQHLGADRPGRRRHHGDAEQGAPADRRLRPRSADVAAEALSRRAPSRSCRPTSSRRS